MIFDNLIKHLQTFAKNAILVIQTTMQQLGKDATGSTSQSLRSAIVFEKANAVQLSIYGSTVFGYIEKGRPKGAKLPPQEAIEAWMRTRAIPISASFAIRKSIAEKGIEPVPVLQISFKKLQATFLPRLKEEILQEIAKGVVDILKDILQKK
jgi:hypothetical protein